MTDKITLHGWQAVLKEGGGSVLVPFTQEIPTKDAQNVSPLTATDQQANDEDEHHCGGPGCDGKCCVPYRAKPLMEQEILEAYCVTPGIHQFISAFKAGVRFAEKHHGITGEEA